MTLGKKLYINVQMPSFPFPTQHPYLFYPLYAVTAISFITVAKTEYLSSAWIAAALLLYLIPQAIFIFHISEINEARRCPHCR